MEQNYQTTFRRLNQMIPRLNEELTFTIDEILDKIKEDHPHENTLEFSADLVTPAGEGALTIWGIDLTTKKVILTDELGNETQSELPELADNFRLDILQGLAWNHYRTYLEQTT